MENTKLCYNNCAIKNDLSRVGYHSVVECFPGYLSKALRSTAQKKKGRRRDSLAQYHILIKRGKSIRKEFKVRLREKGLHIKVCFPLQSSSWNPSTEETETGGS